MKGSKVLLLFFVPVLILFGVGFVFGPLGTSFFGTKTPSFLKVPEPTVELPAEPVLHIGHFAVTNTLIASWFTIIVLVVLAFILTRKMKLIPGKRQAMAEAIVEGLLNFVESVAGKKHARRLFTGVATIFLYVISNAYLALLPFFGSIGIFEHDGKFAPLFRAANTDVNVPLSIAIMSFIFVEYWGMKALGVTHYLSEFINFRQLGSGLKQLLKGKIGQGAMDIVFGFINLFVGVLEIFSHLTRMLSFTFRLFGNMTAGEILILVSSFLIPAVFSIPFYGLELLIGLIQALIFSGLTLVFGTIAVSPHEETE
ncbi:MAG TPA: F0F1 ATP synthase subunit A [Thermodesulfobacteriota bacterium]|nr:F0F1 ATP synthase subunit A [Thermodesulfobacteriota bacterium]